jgi:putative hydrolase of HD superfamily
MFGEHLKEVRSLMELKRYQNKFKHKKRSVAEHSWFVSKIAHGLAIWERDKFRKHDVDIEKVLFLAINHDMIESYTGDIISTTKNLSPILKEELVKVEESIFNNHIIGTIPKSWGKEYLKVHEEMSTLSTIESKIVKAADLIDRNFECIEEIDLGNLEPFTEILKRDLKKLGDFGLISVDYFLKYSVRDFGISKYIPEKTKKRLDSTDYSQYF